MPNDLDLLAFGQHCSIPYAYLDAEVIVALEAYVRHRKAAAELLRDNPKLREFISGIADGDWALVYASGMHEG